jgi:hypothetical protein
MHLTTTAEMDLLWAQLFWVFDRGTFKMVLTGGKREEGEGEGF